MKITLFGATGLVGSSVLEYALSNSSVDEIVCPTRKALSISSSKVKNPTGLQLENVLQLVPAIQGSAACVCAVGTTLKTAGSKKAFYQIDHDLVFEIAKTAKEAGIAHFLFVSSVGARTTSSTFYLRVKGETEEKLISLRFPQLTIVRPSLLLGDRKESRIGEAIARAIMPLFNPLLCGGLKPYRAIKANDVAKALVNSAITKSSQSVDIISYEALRERALCL